MSKIKILKQLIDLIPSTGSEKWIIDGGCHIGRFSNEAIKELPETNVLAFEPDPESWILAKNNTDSYKQIHSEKIIGFAGLAYFREE